MSDPFIGEIRLLGFPRVPNGWLACDGSLQSIANYDTLYALIGTTYGGDGQTTFALPDLRGRLPISQGNGRGLTPRGLGAISGEPGHSLTQNEMPSHGHSLVPTSSVGSTVTPGPTVRLATTSASADVLYAPAAGIPSYSVMATQSVAAAGIGAPHDNMMPSLVCNFCICYAGVFPTASS